MNFPRSVAMQLAEFERNSLRARAQASRRCRPLWGRAAGQADFVLKLLRDHRDQPAATAALRIGPYWKAAADCEGWPTPDPRLQEGEIPTYLGAAQEAAEQAAAEAPSLSVEEVLRLHGAALARIQKASEESLLFRKIATGAAIAGALFAAVRLSDIYFAVKARRALR